MKTLAMALLMMFAVNPAHAKARKTKTTAARPPWTITMALYPSRAESAGALHRLKSLVANAKHPAEVTVVFLGAPGTGGLVQQAYRIKGVRVFPDPSGQLTYRAGGLGNGCVEVHDELNRTVYRGPIAQFQPKRTVPAPRKPIRSAFPPVAIASR